MRNLRITMVTKAACMRRSDYFSPTSRRKARLAFLAKAPSVASSAPSRAAADIPAIAIVTNSASSSALHGILGRDEIADRGAVGLLYGAAVSARRLGIGAVAGAVEHQAARDPVMLRVEACCARQRAVNHLGDAATLGMRAREDIRLACLHSASGRARGAQPCCRRRRRSSAA